MAFADAGSLREHSRQHENMLLPLRFVAQATSNRRNTKKSFSEATWIFCMEPNCFGIIKGEQPLVCNGDDRGQRPKQGGAVGAAACRMRVPRKARSRRREPQPAVSRASESSGDLAALNTRHLLCKPVCGLKAPLGLSCPVGTAVLSGSLLARKRERTRRRKIL